MAHETDAILRTQALAILGEFQVLLGQHDELLRTRGLRPRSMDGEVVLTLTAAEPVVLGELGQIVSRPAVPGGAYTLAFTAGQVRAIVERIRTDLDTLAPLPMSPEVAREATRRRLEGMDEDQRRKWLREQLERMTEGERRRFWSETFPDVTPPWEADAASGP